MTQSRNGNHGACQLKRQKVVARSAREKAGWCDGIVFDRKADVCTAIPCCIKEPTPNQKLLRRVKLFSTTSEPGLQGCASYHSYGLNLATRQNILSYVNSRKKYSSNAQSCTEPLSAPLWSNAQF